MNRLLAVPMSFALAASMSLVACQDYLFEPVSPSLLAVINVEYELITTTKADILFVVDDSGSMAGEQQNLIDSFDVFINTIEAENQVRLSNEETPLDYQIAVVSTSISLTYDPGTGPVTIDTYNVPPGFDCQTPYDISNGDPYPAGRFMAAPGNREVLNALALGSDELIRQFKQNVQLGICGSGQEQGLLAMKRALELRPDFVREGSKLLVVFLSDEEDCSDPDKDTVLSTVEDVCVREANLAAGGTLGSISEYVTFLRGRSDSVAVGVIVSADPVCTSTACEAACGSPDPRTAPCFCGGQSPGGRYLAFRDSIGGESLADSICLDSFATTLEDLADIIIKIDCVGLDATPFEDDPSLILLKITPESGPEILCKSPPKTTPATGCGDDAELGWEYLAAFDTLGDRDPVDYPRICLCQRNTTSGCQIEPGDKYKVSFVQLACSESNPCP